jgi:hypothetical protein
MKSICEYIQTNLMPNDASLIGVFKGRMQTVNQTLATHLEAYSKRQLTYQSDALNVIRGILDIINRFPMCSSSHYCGIPIVAAYYGVDRVWNKDSGSRDQSPSTGAFTFRLLWYPSGICARRRDGLRLICRRHTCSEPKTAQLFGIFFHR